MKSRTGVPYASTRKGFLRFDMLASCRVCPRAKPPGPLTLLRAWRALEYGVGARLSRTRWTIGADVREMKHAIQGGPP
jgi:hypothetical protein